MTTETPTPKKTPMERFRDMRKTFNHFTSDGEMYCALRILFFEIATDHDRLERQRDQATNKLDSLRNYEIRHLSYCAAGRDPLYECTCGLEELLK